MDKGSILKQTLKSNLREHEIMRNFTTLKIGGVADFFYDATTVEDLISAIKAAKKANIPYFILGNGSNIIFSDYGFPGLVIKNSTSNLAFLAEKSQVITDSGVLLSRLILESTSHNLSGLEFLFGIPGTIGGAMYGNAGAYGQSISDHLKLATLLIPNDKDREPEVVQREAEWFQFGYRTSRLKQMAGLQKPIILTAIFQLAQNRQEEIMRRLNNYKEQRLKTQPVGLSAGCIFQNPIPEELENVQGHGTIGMPEVPKERTAGFMLESSGAKKLRMNNVRVSPKHANFVLTQNNAKAHEVRKLIEEMRAGVKKKFDVNLKEEIEYIGQW